MSTSKLKIDLSQGIIEVEGTEEFVLGIYNEFKEKIGTEVVVDNRGSNQPDVTKKTTKKSASAKKTKTTKTRKKSSGQIPTTVKDLDLSGGDKCERLKEYYSTFDAKSNFDKNLIFIYYLEHKLGINNITVDHVFTCYRDIPTVKAPEALRQSLIDTSKRKGWLDTSDTENITVTIPGVNFIEHDMPSKGID